MTKTHKKDSTAPHDPHKTSNVEENYPPPSGEYPVPATSRERFQDKGATEKTNEEQWTLLFGPRTAESSSDEAEIRPSGQRGSVDWVWFRLTDTLGYDRVFIKPEDETLYSVVRTYALTCGFHPTHIHLSNGTCAYSDDVPISRLHLRSGSTIYATANLGCVLPRHDRQWRRGWLILSPKDKDGNPYQETSGGLTRADELLTEVLLRDVWPGIPDVLLRVRALESVTIADVIEAANRAICRYTYSLACHNPELDIDRPLGTFSVDGIARVELTRSGNGRYLDLYQDEVEFHIDPQVKASEAVRFVVEVIDDPGGVEGQNRRVGIGMSPLALVRTMVRKAVNRFGLHGRTHYLTHGFSNLRGSSSIEELGFLSGRIYEVELHKGSPSTALRWLAPPEKKADESPVTLLVIQPTGDLVAVDAALDQLLITVLQDADVRFGHPPRVLENGRRLHLLSTVEELGLTNGSELQVCAPLVGGGGARCSTALRVTSGPQKRPSSPAGDPGEAPVAPPLRASSTGDEDEGVTEAAGKVEANRSVPEALMPAIVEEGNPEERPANPEAARIVRETLARLESETGPEAEGPEIRTYFPYVGNEDHGILRGEATDLPSPSADHFRFQFDGDVIGRWGCLIHKHVPFATVTAYFEGIYGVPDLRYMLNGVRIEVDSLPCEIEAEDLDLIYVSAPLIGGGPGSTGSSFAATRGMPEESSDEEGGDLDDESGDTIRENPYRREQGIDVVTHSHSPPRGLGTSFSLQEAAGRTSVPTFSDDAPEKVVGAQTSIQPRASLKGLIPAKGLQVSTFKGQNVKTFIARYERMGAAYGATPPEMVDYLLFYVCAEEPHDILSILEAQDSYKDRDWEGVKEFLLQHFDGEDEDYKFTLNDLESFVKTPRTFDTKADLNLYTLQFREIGDRLLRAERITRPEAFRKYVRGLPPALRQSLQHSTFAKVNPSFDDIVKEVRDHFRPKHVFRLAQQVEERETAQQEKSTPARLPGLKFHSPGSSLRTNQHEDLSQQFAQMSTAFSDAVTKALTSTAAHTQSLPPRPPTPSSRYPSSTPASGPNAVAVGERRRSCAYCDDPGHMRRDCGVLTDHIRRKLVTISPENEIQWSDGSKMIARFGRYAEQVNQAGTRPGPSNPTGSGAPPMAANYLHLVEDDDGYEELFQSNDTRHKRKLDDLATNRELRSRPNHAPGETPRPIVRFSENPGSLPENAGIQTSDPYAVPPELSTGGPSSGPGPLGNGGSRGHAEANQGPGGSGTEGVEAGVGTEGTSRRGPAFFKRYTDLRRELVPRQVFDKLLDAPVQLPWRDIVGLSPDLQKLFNDCTRNKNIPMPVTGRAVPWDGASVAQEALYQLNSTELGAHSLVPYYSHGLPMVRLTVGGFTVDALLDTGSQINLIDHELHGRLDLPLRFDGNHKVIGAGQHSSSLSGIAESIPVTVGSMTSKIHFWVHRKSNYAAVIGMPGLRALGFVIDCTRHYVTMRSPDGVKIRIPAISPTDPATKTYLGPPPSQRVDDSSDSEGEEVAMHRVNHLRLEPSEWSLEPTEYHFNTKRKSVAEKVRALPIASSLPTAAPLRRPPFERDPFVTPLTPWPPPFRPTEHLTEERMEQISFGPPGFLNEAETNLLKWCLALREKALAFCNAEKGLLSAEYADPIRIELVNHEVWTDRTIPYPKALRSKILALLNESLALGDLELSTSPYVTGHFFVPKKNGDIRHIIDMRSANAVTVRDANIPPYLPDFVDMIVGRRCLAILDMYFFYGQLPLAPESRALTAQRTPLGHVESTKLPQGAANSVAWGQRVSNHVGGSDIPEIVVPFIDDNVVLGPRSDYDDERLPNSEIRRWVFEHAVNVERILYRFEHAHLTASGKKMVVIAEEVEVMGVLVGRNGKRPCPTKLDKIQAWPNPCPSQASLRGFLGLLNFIRPFIKDFAVLDAPLRKLVGKKFQWSEDASSAVNALKAASLTHPFLGVLDYTSGDEIVLSVDSSQIAAGFVLSQERKEGRVIILYDSIAFADVETRYSQPKLELCGVYKAVRKTRYHLIGTPFILEVDAASLRQMINQPDVSNAAMLRWIAHLRLYDFEIRHVPGKLHVIPDGLSRTNFENAEEAEEWPDEPTEPGVHPLSVNTHEIDPAQVPLPPSPTLQGTDPPAHLPESDAALEAPSPALEPLPFAEDKYQGRWRTLGYYLASGGTHPSFKSLPRDERRWILSQLRSFFLFDRRIWRRNPEGLPLLVLDNDADKMALMASVHNLGHRGRDAMTGVLLQRVWWEKIRVDCYNFVRRCQPCQLRAPNKEVEAQRSAPIPGLFDGFAIDIVDLGQRTGVHRYLVLARCLLTSWVEGRALSNKLASSVAKFIEDDILARYGPVVRTILTDNGPENLAETHALLVRLGLKHATITPHHPQGNSVVERGHRAVVEGLLKASYGDRERTALYLPQVLWADRITARASTGYSPFELVFGREPLLPVDHEARTFAMMQWDLISTRADLLAARALQLKRRDQDLATARVLLDHARARGRTYLDLVQSHRLREPLPPGTTVLVSGTASHPAKSSDRWRGPYVIVRQLPGGSYVLRELDGSELSTPVGANRLRRFFPSPEPVEVISRAFLDGADLPSGDVARLAVAPDVAGAAPAEGLAEHEAGIDPSSRPEEPVDAAPVEMEFDLPMREHNEEPSGLEEDLMLMTGAPDLFDAPPVPVEALNGGEDVADRSARSPVPKGQPLSHE
ncbi:hypothetical protein CF326_g6021 [Tilletia indica]|nr:hypothetical protein CF326_g6021 [Tilletia indica]